MKILTKTLSLVVVVFFTLSLLSVTACGWKPSEKDIQALEETRAAALAAEKTQEEKKSERMDLEKQVNAKKAELQKLEADKEKVKKHVEQE